MLLNSKHFKREVLAILDRIYHSPIHDEGLIKVLRNFNQTYPLVLVLAYFVAIVVFSFFFFFFFSTLYGPVMII